MTLLNIKWEKAFWLNIAETVLSFPWPGLDADVHFSISFNPNSHYVNIHLTRNLYGVAPADKPKIRIAQIARVDMEEIGRLLWYRYWHHAWAPFDIRHYQNRRSAVGRKAQFLSITRLEKA